MKLIISILLFNACRSFAAEDPSLLAAGEWSKPAAIPDGYAIRGRLLICDTRHDAAVFLELQESTPRLAPV